jgi:hypothetical protein
MMSRVTSCVPELDRWQKRTGFHRTRTGRKLCEHGRARCDSSGALEEIPARRDARGCLLRKGLLHRARLVFEHKTVETAIAEAVVYQTPHSRVPIAGALASAVTWTRDFLHPHWFPMVQPRALAWNYDDGTGQANRLRCADIISR